MRRYNFEVKIGDNYDNIFDDYIIGESLEEALLNFIYWMEDNFVIEDHTAIVLATDIDDENRKHMKFVVYPTGEYEEVDELAFNDIRS